MRPRPPRWWVGLLLYPPAVLSLLVALAAGFMWGRSHWKVDRAGRGWQSQDGDTRRYRDIYGWSAKGGVLIQIHDTWNPSWAHETRFFHVTDGMMMYPYVSGEAPGVPHTYYSGWGFGYSRVEHPRERLWMEIDGRRWTTGDRAVYRSVVVPWGAMMVVALLLPVLALRRMIRVDRWTVRKRKGLCQTCGYNLKESPERCPECGTPVVARSGG